MQIELYKTIKVNVEFLEVEAYVRHWEDATLNGVTDSKRDIPLRQGEYWVPVINLRTGVIKDWPDGVTASVHYKVCDSGEYWFQDATGQRVAKWRGSYVPDEFLCPNESGYGDYIILKIDGHGTIDGWRTPTVDADEWEAV